MSRTEGSPRGSRASGGSRPPVGLGGLSGLALLSPRLSAATRALSPRDTIGLLRLGINPEALSRSPGVSRGPSPSSRAASAASRGASGSRCRFLSPEDEERLALKGAQERIRAEARERREQLREAQRLQAEQELLVRQQRRSAEREAQKRLIEKDRFEQWRRRLERRDISRAKLWEKFPRLGTDPDDLERRRRLSRSPAASPAASPRSSPRPSQALSPRLSMSSSMSALLSPRDRLRSWDLNIASYSREEVQQLESERMAALADKELRVLQARETKFHQRINMEARRDRVMGSRTNELEALRLAREEKRQQEIRKRARDREQRIEQRQMRRAGEVGSKEYEARVRELRVHQQRERKVYIKQQEEEQAEEQRLIDAGRKELEIQEARVRHEREREVRQRQQLLEQGAKEREAEAVRDAREALKEELRQRRVRDLELKRAKVLAVKADQEERRKKKEEEKSYIYTSPPRLSDKVKAAAAEAMANWDAQFVSLSNIAATA